MATDSPAFRAAVQAVERGDVDRVRQLLSAEPSLLEAVDHADHPSTLLHLAAAADQPRMVSALLALGAAVDTYTWATPLGVAACYGRSENARILLEAGAAFDARTRLGATPLALAVLHGHPAVADLLAQRGIVPRTLWIAAGAGDLPLTTSFLRADGTLVEGAGLFREDPHEYGMPARPRSDAPHAIIAEAFTYACANARTAVARYMLDVGVDIDGTWHVGTALHWAAYSGHLDMVRFLVNNGADISSRDDEWHATAKGWAEQRGHHAVVEALSRYEG